MKILLLGDYSNYHACLAEGLRRQGHSVTVASDGSGWMDTSRNVSLRRPLPGYAGGALLYMKMLIDGRIKGYDIVSLISPSFVTLRPHRLRRVFERLRRHNGAIFLSATGTDKAVMDMYFADDCPLRYSEYFMADGSANPAASSFAQKDLEWCKGAIGDFCEFIYDNVAGVTTALYEYDLAMRRRLDGDMVSYVGIPVDLEALKPVDTPLMADGRLHMFLGRHSHRMAFKGTDIIGSVAEKVAAEYPDRCVLDIVENIPYADYLQRLRSADFVLDQLYSYTPATNALLAMAAGQATLSGGEPEYYDFIGEKDLKPVINAVPDEVVLYDTLRSAVLNPSGIIDAAAQGREFVRKHNDVDVVAQRCMDFWTSKL